jgi:hypothetical protein
MIVDSKYVRAAHSFHPSFYDVRPRVWVDGVIWSESPIVEAESHGCAEVSLYADLTNPNEAQRGFSLRVSGDDDYGWARRFGVGEIELAMNWFNRIPSPIGEDWLLKHDFDFW